ncbi:glycosyltransferase family 2 protein [Rubrivirga marina]|uniref:Glycosyltransferase 2-like domain-containing protein n=1 Tax=Rubrivirga marina TaxID=1196024 RepID=A0A271J488_9BACT|nr:glycosyltransferase family 2 protein [Rubrivirga marina]PAP77765.1 hypothetical protein BSZ37_15580 [Rubrivirga marina]
MPPAVSLVLPAFNEVENLEDAVAQARGPLQDIDPAWELVIVDDGSDDGTGALADRIALADPHVRVVHHAENRGKGVALRSGVAAARAPVVAYTDADLPFDMEALGRAHARLVETGADLVAGLRTNREQYSLRRRVLSGTYNALFRALLGVPLDDVGFALKVMRRETFERADLQSDGGFIDAELMAWAHRSGLYIERVGVEFTPRVRGTSTMAEPASVAGILRDLMLFRLGRLRPRRAALPRETPA